MKNEIHIAIAEDHDLVRDGLVSQLKEYPGISVLFDVRNGLELINELRTNKPQVILLDLEMPVMSGREALEKIRQRYPRIKIIILSAFYDDGNIIDYVKKGVHAFLPKNCKIDKVVEAIHKVCEQGAYFDGHVSLIMAKELAGPKPEPQLPENQEPDLSDKEVAILKMICRNSTSEEIAEALSLSKKTIDYHRAKIMRKTGSESVMALVTFALQSGIISISPPEN